MKAFRDENVARTSAAIAESGSPKFTHHAGATLELMSDQGRVGDLNGLSLTLLAHAKAFPKDRRFLINQVPAKILNQYIYLHRQLPTKAIERWRERTPDWADRLKKAVLKPTKFVTVVTNMADEIARSEVS
jgi:hypothetical protein